MGDTAANAIASVIENYVGSSRSIGKFSLYDDAETTQLKEHVGAVFTVYVDRLAVSGNAVA